MTQSCLLQSLADDMNHTLFQFVGIGLLKLQHFAACPAGLLWSFVAPHIFIADVMFLQVLHETAQKTIL